MNVNKQHLDVTMQGKLMETYISQSSLRCIVSIFVNLALVLLPLYAVDYPSVDKRDYMKLLIQWSKRCNQVISHYISEFKGGDFSNQSMSGRISAIQFIEKAQELQIFNVLQIREVAKKTMLIADHNPNINRDAVLDKGLFTERLRREELNEDEETAIEEALSNVPQMFSDAVLYKAAQNMQAER